MSDMPGTPGRVPSVGSQPLMSPTAVGPLPIPQTVGRRFVRIRRHPPLIVSAVILGCFAVLAAGAPWIAPFRFDAGDPMLSWGKPSAAHPFGTDSLGRDVLSRLIYGSRISLAVGVASMAVATLLGGSVGAVSGYVGGATDLVLMHLIDVVLAFPSLLFILLLSVVLRGGVTSIVLAVGLTRWAQLARIVRADFLRLRSEEFVLAAHALGAGPLRIVRRHILPNALASIIVYVSFGIPFAIVAEAALSFIGLGVSPPTPSWGVMLNEGFSSFRSFPNLVLFPSLAISLTMLGFVAFGNGLQDLLDPKLRQ